ncbi:hypothetical protein NVV94_05700 [Pseudomonas sp. LS1212]|uniref:hypothetical protein n=1 Tax=Pseudomonas sp. LS1212 TaxID=2972478 RepID=UPI00215CFA36|nr:hypothetical protein [Pseudomonas sp. LS1212]UVJ45076.1 hypothetical protein NVV94_05700 [Pseudomonas sp. LS1212]
MTNILNRPVPPRQEQPPAPTSTHPGLARLERKFRSLGIELPDKVPPEPVDVNGLGAAIQQLIDQTVAERVAEALKEQQQRTERMQQQSPAPVPPASKPVPAILKVTQRDENGRIAAMSITPVPSNTFPPPASKPTPAELRVTQRDEHGRIMAMSITPA